MKTIANLLTSLLVAFWVIGIAIVAIQNAELISLRFLSYQSIQIPFGLLLAFSAGIGMIGMGFIIPVWGLSGSARSNSVSDDDPEFFTED